MKYRKNPNIDAMSLVVGAAAIPLFAKVFSATKEPDVQEQYKLYDQPTTSEIAEALLAQQAIYPWYAAPSAPVYIPYPYPRSGGGHHHHHPHQQVSVTGRSMPAPRVSSLVSAPRVSAPRSQSTITGRTSSARLAGIGDFSQEVPVIYKTTPDSSVVSSGVVATIAPIASDVLTQLKQGSEESTAFLQQAAKQPDQILENAQKMSPLGILLTLYTANWAWNLLSK